MWSMVQPQSWTAVTGNPLLNSTFLTASACPASLLSTSSCGDLLGVKSRPGLDVLLLMSKNHGSVLLLLLLDHPLVFPGAGEERDDFSLTCSPLQRVCRSGCSCLFCGCLAECVVDGLSPAAPL